MMFTSQSTQAPSLRGGSNGPWSEQLAAIQRARILAAAMDTVDEVGYARMTVTQVVRRARVSRRTFYELFRDRDDCVLAVFEQALSRARLLAAQAYGQESCWREGVRAALERLLVFMEEEPVVARLCLVEALAAGDGVLERRARALDELVEIIDRGRSLASAAHEPPRVAAEGIVGGILGVLQRRMLEDPSEPLRDLFGPLMSIVVRPYLGATAASRELRRPPPATLDRRLRPPERGRDPLDGLKIRLSHRTVLVLRFIGERPGASNREIAAGSGIVDQGQISRLLNRLARLDLIQNHGGGQEKGAANAWQLTARGARLERDTRPLARAASSPVR